jgi:protein-L-isoaspartate O-methyltransferase
MPTKTTRRPGTAGSTTIPDRVVWAVEQLAIQPRDRVLEIGCGPGLAVSLVCAKLGTGSITAIDRSPLQVAKTRARNRNTIERGRAQVELLSLTDAPAELGEHRFNKVFAINVNAFWTAPASSVAALLRLTSANGSVFLFYEPPGEASLRKLRASLPRLIEAQGLSIAELRTSRWGTSHGLCVVAHRDPHPAKATTDQG